ncbi:uncharacterized protein LOC129312536 [Prosopis cineraria]|uniref:uncharacterized protein LOC129312536 n=1 Tax=Prosopis cineraria TaxID=364024 RepID=UPI0024106137|nr:uncharacterized protein LOC129312536 [Prosopis cineraria]XP_054811165.1 uncharacterized protein LOC129312536 [Prosopis cineraria]XP_054811166.1 uncharacterized protein LOC129312536 [Prosopis cineraria]XP_054811167.1 uncharacterized protein LOC129312536 [Prosopis cineraria]
MCVHCRLTKVVWRKRIPIEIKERIFWRFETATGQIVKHHGAQPLASPSFAKTNQALNVIGVQEIVYMMKLEGSETYSIGRGTHDSHQYVCPQMIEALKCYAFPMECCLIYSTFLPLGLPSPSLNQTRESWKKLKDACLLGFDKDWLESIKTMVFNCDYVTEVDCFHEILKGLDSDSKTNEAILAATCNQEVEAV